MCPLVSLVRSRTAAARKSALEEIERELEAPLEEENYEGEEEEEEDAELETVVDPLGGFEPGEEVVTQGLHKNPEIDGCPGLLKKFDFERERWKVEITTREANDDGSPKKTKKYIMAVNLRAPP